MFTLSHAIFPTYVEEIRELTIKSTSVNVSATYMKIYINSAEQNENEVIKMSYILDMGYM